MEKIFLTKNNYNNYIGRVVLIGKIYSLILDRGSLALFSSKIYKPNSHLQIPCPYEFGLDKNNLIYRSSGIFLIDVFLAYSSLEELFKDFPTIDIKIYVERIKGLCKNFIYPTRNSQISFKIIG